MSAESVAVITDIQGNLSALEAWLGGAFTVLTPRLESVEVRIEWVAYDADAVAAEVREAGLPGEFADKLLVAA